MKFTCLQENLAKGLSIVSKAISVKVPLPILSNVLLSTENGRIKLTASNLETTISTYIGASIEEEGSITVPAKLLHEYVSHLSSGTISCHVKDDVFHITSQNTKSRFNGTSATEFPDLPTMPENSSAIEMDPKLFRDIISVVAFSASTGESRPVLSGILLSYSEGIFTVAAADGFRLSEKTTPLSTNVQDFSVIIPAKTLLEIARLFSVSTESIKFILNNEDSLALFESDGTFVASRIIEGSFPDYKKIIPASSLLNAKFKAAALLDAVKLTNVFAKEESRESSIVTLVFDPVGKIKITSSAKESGENESEVLAEVTGDLVEIAFNSKYLLEFLTNVKTEEIIFETNGTVAPGVLKPVDHQNYIHIVMPVRLKS